MPGQSMWMELSLDINPASAKAHSTCALHPVSTGQSILAHPLAEIVDGALEPFTEFSSWLPRQFLTKLVRVNHAPYLFTNFSWPMNFLACRIRVRD